MEKFIEWFSRHRQTIGYVVGGLNVANGFLEVTLGNTVSGVCFIVLGSAIIFDAKEFK